MSVLVLGGTAWADDARAPARVADSCAACHGGADTAADPQYPDLSGQPAAYLRAQLRAFRDGRRPSEVMAGFAAPLNDAEIAGLAAYFAARRAGPPAAAAVAPDPAAVRRGARVFAAGDQGRPACAACHDPAGARGARGQGRTGAGMGRGMGGGGMGGMMGGMMATDPALTPRIAGQPAGYLSDQLDAFAAGTRPASVMTAIAARLSRADRAAVAAYLSQRK